jgi:hypothetical protein
MDADGDSKGERQISKKSNVLQRSVTYVGNVLSSIRIRCIIQNDNGYERFLLGSGYSFLLNFRFLLVVLYITYEISK